MEHGARVFGSKHKYLKNVGVMIVYKKLHEIALTFNQNEYSEFEACINTIEKGGTITLDDPPAAVVSDADDSNSFNPFY